MGTHPIFESDFDCLTECHSYSAEDPNASFAAKLFTRPKKKYPKLESFTKHASDVSRARSL